MFTPQIESVLVKMAELEKAVSRLYELYAKRFPSHEGMWTALSKEETEHATWICKLTEHARQGKLDVDPNRFKAEAVQMVLDSLARHSDQAETGNPSLLSCLSIAVNLENALLEKDVFKIFESDSAEMKDVLNRLAGATGNHQRTIKQAWLAAKENGHA